MALKYKATLYETPEECEFLYVSEAKQKELNKPKPIDSALLNEKCYATAEREFFNKRGWMKGVRFHIEIEDMPRVLA